MKKSTTLILLALCATTLFAQAPEKFTYQAVVRNSSNHLVTNTLIGVRVSIIQGSATGSGVYVETQMPSTNANGLITLNIGDGNVIFGSFSNINWENGPYFLKTEIDPNGGNDYSLTTMQQLLSVPYALYAKDAGNGFSGDYNDLTNTPVIPTVPTDISVFNNDAGYITGYIETDPQYNAWDKDYNDLINKPVIPTVPTNVSAFNNDIGYITNADIPTIPAIPENVSAFVNDVPYLTSFTEQQVLTISNDTIFLTGGSFVKLPESFDGDYNSLTNKPIIPIIPTDISIFNNDAGYLTNADIPEIPTVPTNVSAFMNDAGYLTEYTEIDPQFNAWDKDYNDLINKPTFPTLPENVSAFNNDVPYLTTEQQILSISNDTIFLTGGSFVKLPVGFSGNYNDLTNKPLIPTNVSAFNNDAHYISNTECTDVDLCALATALSQLQALIEDQQQRIEELEAQIGSNDTTTTPTDNPTIIDGSSCPGAPSVTDIDGNVYNTVQIGTQCWMRENLRTTRYANGDLIAEGTTYSEIIPYRYAPNGNASTVTAYGYLYNWPAVMHGDSSSNANPSGVQGICPTGWHVPSEAEWDQLINYVNSQSEFLCGGYNNFIAKALASNIGWNYHNVNNACAVCNNLSLNNATGFSAMPAGESYGSSSWGLGDMASFSSSTSDSYGYVELRGFCYEDAEVTEWPCDADGDIEEGVSVRCVRGEGSTGQHSKVITIEVSDITSTTAVCHGQVINSGASPITARGVCYSTNPNPTLANSHTSDGTGAGAFTSYLTGLSSATLYYVRAYATNNLDTTYGEEMTFITTNPNDGQPCTNTPTLTDYDGNVYNTVQIGAQCWMKENLRTTHYTNGEVCNMPSGYSFNQHEPWRFNPDENAGNVTTYGYLYNQAAVMHGSEGSASIPSGVQGICPAGWHLPSLAEFQLLTSYIKSNSIYHCGNNNEYIAKALAHTTGWESSTASCAPGYAPSTNNSTGFSARPSGYHTADAYSFGYSAYFWSASTYSTNNELKSYYFNIANYSPEIESSYWNGGYYYHAYSVRCVRDENNGTATAPTVTTDTVMNATVNMASFSGTVTSSGGATVTEYGVCWSTSPNPNLSNEYSALGSGLGSFTGNFGPLSPNTTYYVRAYATNSAGTGYGEVKTILFTSTLNDGITVTFNDVTWEAGAISGFWNSDMGAWETYAMQNDGSVPAVDIATSITGGTSSATANSQNGSLGGSFKWVEYYNEISLNDIDGNYYGDYWAKSVTCSVSSFDATSLTLTANVNATMFSAAEAFIDSYGAVGVDAASTAPMTVDIVNVTLVNSGSSVTLPTVTTDAVSSATGNTASFSGTVTSNGGATVTECGVCWNTSPNPNLSNHHSALGSGMGSFTGTFGPLTPNTTYYVRAYATNSAGTGYGDVMTFTTGDFPTSNNGVTVTFNNTTWEASSISGTWYNNYGCWNISAKQNEGSLPMADIATTITGGTSSFTADSQSGSIGSNYNWVEYYKNTYLVDGNGIYYGDYWAKNATFTVSAFDATTLTLSANVNATMFSAAEAFLASYGAVGVDAASTAPMTVNIVNVTLDNQ